MKEIFGFIKEGVMVKSLCPPPHPYVEILPLNVIVLGGGPWIVIRP